ncbi:hypothetical protein [Prevotella pectinovora]|uniref:hypothetical protein n=1 Tax=Prevotella pectinovora TaxID=1602169 RepID=UPI00307D5154
MSLPLASMEDYSMYITLSDDELFERRIAQTVIERIHRLRGLYAYWLQFPQKFDQDIVQYDMAMFKVGKSQAYDDLHLVRLILGNLQQASKDFMRWKINQDLEQDLKAARRAGDHRSVAAIEKNRIINNRTDKEDELELEFDKIIPQQFVPVDDPTVLGIKKLPDLRNRIRMLVKKYSDNSVQFAEYEELKEDNDNGATDQ